MDTTRSGGRHKILQMSVCPNGGGLHGRGVGRGVDRGRLKIKRKKKKKATCTKSRSKSRIARWRCLPFLRSSSISSLHLRNPQIQTNVAAGHTDVTNAGHLHLAARVLPHREPSAHPLHPSTSSPASSARFVSLFFFRSPIRSVFSSFLSQRMDRLHPA